MIAGRIADGLAPIVAPRHNHVGIEITALKGRATIKGRSTANRIGRSRGARSDGSRGVLTPRRQGNPHASRRGATLE